MQLFLDKTRMQLHLIDGRDYAALLLQFLQMMNLKIADTNRPHAAFLVQALQGTPSVLI
ncbi:hypothetical protein D3C74_506240 [compost metagenome]